MGKRGPQRTPTQLLKVHGSWRADEREKKEPKPEAKKPKTNIKLTQQERRIYNQVCDQVKSLGLQAVTDGNAIARYAVSVVRWNKAKTFIEKNGESYPVYQVHKDGSKTIRMHKRYTESTIVSELEAIIIRLEREFGLTPSSRASLQVEIETPTDDRMSYLA